MNINLGENPLNQHNVTEQDINITINHTGKNNAQSHVDLSHPLRSTDQPNKIKQSDINRKRVNQNSDVEMLSENGLSHKIKGRNRVSLVLQSALQRSGMTSSQGKQIKEEREIKSSLKRSKISKIVGNKINTFFNITHCDICEAEMKKDDKMMFMCECEHKFDFCESCLHHYAIYKVKVFEEVTCPRDGCSASIDTNGLFFKQLPIDIQKNYRKIHLFYQTSKDPTKKLCPKQNCEGIIQNVTDGAMVCKACKSMFCGKCLLDMHEGLCDQHEVEFFQNNLHYRQCKMCKVVIQKNQGCNHMTCRCGYQFCYVCSADWEVAHYGNHDQNGNLVVVRDEIRHQNSVDCGTWCCHMVTHPCSFSCKCVHCILRILLLLLYFIFFIMFLFLGIVGTLFMGITVVFVQFITDLHGIRCVLAVIFFPICMLVGIAISFKQFFWDFSGNRYQQFRERISECSHSISQICSL